jgi:hypothetical protein
MLAGLAAGGLTRAERIAQLVRALSQLGYLSLASGEGWQRGGRCVQLALAPHAERDHAILGQVELLHVPVPIAAVPLVAREAQDPRL